MSSTPSTPIVVIGDVRQGENDLSGNRGAAGQFRGPLRYEVKTSLQQLEAGRKFSVILRITNPYDVPVRVVEAETELPIEFKAAVTGRSRFRQLFDQELQAELDQAQPPIISAQPVGAHSDSDRDDELNRPFEPVLLYPGNSVLRAFTLRTRQKTFFTPAVYSLHIQVRYEMNDLLNHDTIDHQISVRAPLQALIYGSALGALVGVALKQLYAGKDTFEPSVAAAAPFLASVLLAAVLVIAFARKRDAQPFIAIEDFYGGFFVGFLAGYVGEPLIKDLLPSSSAAATQAGP